jgi:hypothetical protein
MIALWLLAGSLVGGQQANRLANGFPGESNEAVLQFCITSESTAKSLQTSDAKRAVVHLRGAINGYHHLWERGVRNPSLAARLATLHQQLDELPEAIRWCRLGLQQNPLDPVLSTIIEQLRSEVRWPQSANLNDQNARKTLLPLEIHSFSFLVFGGFAVGWLLIAIRWRRVGITLILLSLIAQLLLIIDATQRSAEANRSSIIVLSAETYLRTGNGSLYPPIIPVALPRGLEAELLLRRGEWSQIRLDDGTIGWTESSRTLRVETS